MANTGFRRQHFQYQPSGTSLELAFTNPVWSPYDMDIEICNVSGDALTVSVCWDINGTEYDEDTALLWNKPMAAGGTIQLDDLIAGYLADEKIAVQCSVASGVTFTGVGTIRDEVIDP